MSRYLHKAGMGLVLLVISSVTIGNAMGLTFQSKSEEVLVRGMFLAGFLLYMFFEGEGK